jgi:hypothetical protein
MVVNGWQMTLRCQCSQTGSVIRQKGRRQDNQTLGLGSLGGVKGFIDIGAATYLKDVQGHPRGLSCAL